MLRLIIGFVIGVGLSVMHYDFGISPNELASIVIKNGNDIVEEVKESGEGKQTLSDSILNSHGFITTE